MKVIILSLFALSVLSACGGGSSSNPAPAEAVTPPPAPAPVDTTPPVITLNGPTTIDIVVGSDYVDAGADVSDDVDNNLDLSMQSNVDTSQVGSYTVIYSATDSAGNAAESVTRIVNVIADETVAQDTTPPVLSLNGDAIVSITVGTDYTDLGATATDDIDGSITPTIISDVDSSQAGSYLVTFTATDSAGNVATITRLVNVLAEQTGNNVLSGWGANDYLKDVINNAQASVVGIGEFYISSTGVMISDRHILTNVGIITRGLEVDYNRKVTNIWGEVSRMKNVIWEQPGEKTSLCIIELETPFQNYYVPPIAEQAPLPNDYVFKVSQSANALKGGKGWSVSFGNTLSYEQNSFAKFDIPGRSAPFEGIHGAGIFNENGELVGISSGPGSNSSRSAWYIPNQPVHNRVMNENDTNTVTEVFTLNTINNLLRIADLNPISGGTTNLPINEPDVDSQFVPSNIELEIQEQSELTKNSVVTLNNGSCSGTLIRNDLVLTNAHCVVHNDDVVIGFKDAETIKGSPIALNEAIDIAVVKLVTNAPSKYTSATIASEGFNSRDYAYAVGSPGALWTKYGGWQVSALESIGYRIGDYSMSGSILPGNSGSGVFNLDGEMASVLWGSGDGSTFVSINERTDRQDPHPFDHNPSIQRATTVTMADYGTFLEFATRMGAQGGNDANYIYDNAITSDNQIYAVGREYINGSNRPLITRVTADGQWDATYSLVLDIPNAYATTIQIDQNDQIFVLIRTQDNTDRIVKLTSNGLIDDEFAIDGYMTINFEPSIQASSFDLESNGQFVVAGQIISSENQADIFVARYDNDGTLVQSFGNNGWMSYDIAGFSEYPQKVSVNTNGIYVGATTSVRNNEFYESDFLLSRLTLAGTMDTSFGNDGHVLTQFRDHEQLLDVAFQGDKIIATGQNRGNNQITLVRYEQDGQIDTTFGNEGIVLFGNDEFVQVSTSMTLLSDGDILVTGRSFQQDESIDSPQGGDFDMSLYRFDQNGTPDPTFNGSGELLLDSGDEDYGVNAIELPSGNIVAFGFSHKNNRSSATVSLINPDGVIESSLVTQ